MRRWITLVESVGFSDFEATYGDYVLDLLYNSGDSIKPDTLRTYYAQNLRDLSIITNRMMYRGIWASKEWLVDLAADKVAHIGLCWSGQQSVAQGFMKNGGAFTDERFVEIEGDKLPLMMEATIPEHSIDVNRTIATNGTGGEDEVNAVKGAPILVHRIFFDGQWHEWNRTHNA